MSTDTPSHGRRRRFARLAVVVLLCASLLPAVNPQTAASASQQQIAEELARLRKDVERAGRAYDKAHWRLDEAEVRVAKLDKKLRATSKELKSARKLLSVRVAGMYRNHSGLDYIDLILGADDFESMITRFDFLARIGQQDAHTIARVEALQARLEAEKEQMASEVADRDKSADKLRGVRDRLRSRLESKQSEYNRILARAKAQASSIRGMPKGPYGMVFPVAGVCYYSDTWGASRSGGRRRHKGTDIMAARGTPCVAVLSGTVSARSSALGGKTIWLTADNGWRFYYAHLDRYAVSSGRVRAGQIIGYVGDTGNARGGSPHLHFEIHPAGRGAVNPYPYLRQMQ